MLRNFVLMTTFFTAMVLRAANTIPLLLPRPDGKPGNAAKPVKVYILAGQSNMVGMGDLAGARPPHPSVFLSADPAILPGGMPIGDSALARHGIHLLSDPKAETGAAVSLFEVVFDPTADYAALKPAKTAVVALGTVDALLPTLDGPHTAVARGFIDVPFTGTYTLHAGFGESTHARVILDGREVYRKDVGGQPVIEKTVLVAGRRYPVEITYFRTGSAAFWLEQIDLAGKGDLMTLTKKDGKFPYLVDDEGKWSVRRDVLYVDPRLFPTRAASPLSATSNNGKSIGPELGFGHVIGLVHDEPVLLIKTAMGNRSLGFDFRPPSSGRTAPDNQYEGLEYRLMVQGVHDVLGQLDQIIPENAGQGYEVAGFGWFQGHKDSGSTKAEYEKHLVNLINDLRKEFNAPKMPVVVATVGFHGYQLAQGPWQGVWEAQMAVGDSKQHPEFAGTVASVDIRDFWREVEESPRGQDYHYNRNPETYLLVGEAMGRAMVRLNGGEAVTIPTSDREARTAARVAAEAAKPVPTPEQLAASRVATRPMVLDGALAAFLGDPRNQPRVQAALAGMRPEKPTPFLDDILDEVVAYYQAAGVAEYDWKSFGPDPKEILWDYFSFSLPDTEAATKGIRDLVVTHPAGMENWYTPEFDSPKAGWRSGKAPFGVAHDPNAPVNPEWYRGRPRSSPETAFEGDVLLLRQTFELPPLQEGHRYRIRVFGSTHHNCGEGFALYLNGELLAETKSGVVAWRREGGRPRGGHLWRELIEVFKGGKVTIAVSNFPMNNRGDGFLPARSPLGVWFEEQKLPPLE